MNTGTGGALEDADPASGHGLRSDHTCTRMHVHAGALVAGEQLSVRVCIQYKVAERAAQCDRTKGGYRYR